MLGLTALELFDIASEVTEQRTNTIITNMNYEDLSLPFQIYYTRLSNSTEESLKNDISIFHPFNDEVYRATENIGIVSTIDTEDNWVNNFHKAILKKLFDNRIKEYIDG